MAEVPITQEGFVSPFLENRYERFGAPLIEGIEETTQNAVVDMVNEGLRRGYSPLQIANGVDEEGFDGVVSIFDDDYRSELIARTESMFALNWGAGSGYADSGLSSVEAMDGSDDPECAARDGQIYEIDPDTGMVVDETGEPVKDHPNGTLAFAPYITDQVVESGALDDTGDVIAAEEELGAEYEVKHGTGQTNNPRGGNQHGAGPKVPRKHTHQNGVTHRHIGGARPHKHGSRVIPADSLAFRAKGDPRGDPLAEEKYSPDQPRDEQGRFGEGMGGAGADTSEERAAILAYQGSEYGNINAFLRGELTEENSPQASIQFWDDLHDKVDAISSAMTPLPTDQTVYRAIGIFGSEHLLAAAEAGNPELQPMGIVSGNTVGNMQDSDIETRLQALVGATIEDKAFISTTTDKQVAGAKTGMAPIVFRIEVPAGTMAVDLNAHPELGNDTYANEHEVLLDRDQKFRVDGVSGPTNVYSSEYPVHVVSLSVIK